MLSTVVWQNNAQFFRDTLHKENSQTNLSIKKQNSTKACRQHKLAQGEKAKSGKQHAIPTGGKKNKAGKGKKKLADAARDKSHLDPGSPPRTRRNPADTMQEQDSGERTETTTGTDRNSQKGRTISLKLFLRKQQERKNTGRFYFPPTA